MQIGMRGEKLFFPAESFTKSPMILFAAIGRKCLRIMGRLFLLSQIPVSARHVCFND
jgi:hypothetical protein